MIIQTKFAQIAYYHKLNELVQQHFQLQQSSTLKHLIHNTDRSKSQNVSRKSNVVVYGVEECPPKTPKSVRLQSDSNAVSKVFSSMDVHIESNQVVDCFRLGKFKSNQSRPRPILVKLQHTIDATQFWQIEPTCHPLSSLNQTCLQLSRKLSRFF